jgi:tripeptidyl-peptidase I
MIKIAVGLILLFSFANSSRRDVHVESNFTDSSVVRSYEDHITHTYKESMPGLNARSDLLKKGRTKRDHIHEVIFAVQMRNMDELTRILHDISDPDSDNYGKHMTKDQVNELISNPEACSELTSYITAGGGTVVKESNGGGYITAQAPIEVWEKMFNTEFFLFEQTHSNGETHEVVRAEHYFVPNEIHHHIEAVMHTIEMPVLLHKRPKINMDDRGLKSFRKRQLLALDGAVPDGTVYPNRVRYFYNMTKATGSSRSTQAAYANGDQYFSPDDLEKFQRVVTGQPFQTAIIAAGYSSNKITDESAEGNLDMQWLIGLSPGSPSTFWHFDSSVGFWCRTIAEMREPPFVLSVSYGSVEYLTSAGEQKILTSQAIQLGTMGVTLLAASGDTGSADAPKCVYSPAFPAASPYFVSVGGTMVTTCILYLTSLLMYHKLRYTV